MRHPRSRSLGSLELFATSPLPATVSPPRPEPPRVELLQPQPRPTVPPKQEDADHSKKRAELWLAVHLPELMLDSMRDVSAALPGQPPVAIVDLERNGKVVRACDATAVDAGVRPGMSINAALAL